MEHVLQDVLLSQVSQLSGQFFVQVVFVADNSYPFLHVAHNAPSTVQSAQLAMLQIKQAPLASGVGLNGDRHYEHPIAAHDLHGLLQKSQLFVLSEYPELHSWHTLSEEQLRQLSIEHSKQELF